MRVVRSEWDRQKTGCVCFARKRRPVSTPPTRQKLCSYVLSPTTALGISRQVINSPEPLSPTPSASLRVLLERRRVSPDLRFIPRIHQRVKVRREEELCPTQQPPILRRGDARPLPIARFVRNCPQHMMTQHSAAREGSPSPSTTQPWAASSSRPLERQGGPRGAGLLQGNTDRAVIRGPFVETRV